MTIHSLRASERLNATSWKSIVHALFITTIAISLSSCASGGSRGTTLVPANASNGQQRVETARASGQAGAGENLNGGSLDAGGGALLGMGGDPGNAYPLTPQSLFDFTQTGIAQWGPVAMTQQVAVGGQTYTVNKLASNDPFTAVYQMENGDIVISNEPLERLVGTIVEGPTPPTEAWNGPEGMHTIFSGEIMVLFKDEVTQQQIEAEIATHNLEVLMSWFEPPEEPGTGNAIAYFEFRYDPLEFPTFSDAYAHFNADPLVSVATADALDAFKADYAQGLPNDDYYVRRYCQQVNVLHLDTSIYARFGPPFDPFATTAVAVFDDGVARASEDLQVMGAPPFYRKVSWCGVTAFENPKATLVGISWGEATLPDPDRPGAKVTHGTNVAGTITAATNNNGMGVAGLAPQCGVLPIRLFVTLDQLNNESFSASSIVNAIVAMRKNFRPMDWVENVSVANHSYSQTGAASFNLYNKWFSRDVCRCDRLHVACAGNTCSAEARYPAALVPVLGVSGLVTNGAEWWPNLVSGVGSTWFPDSTGSPELRLYPVSGIYGFRNGVLNEWADVGWVPASPAQGEPATNYRGDFRGTSFAAPQVAALAALLRNARPSARYYEVSNRIVSTRNLAIEQTMINTYSVPLAGLVDFNTALAGW